MKRPIGEVEPNYSQSWKQRIQNPTPIARQPVFRKLSTVLDILCVNEAAGGSPNKPFSTRASQHRRRHHEARSIETGADAARSLTQGLGALVWASDEWQAENECIVLVPTYPETILDDHSGYTTTDYVEMTKRYIDAMTSEYAIDTNRIYGTGQSMGCMTTLILASEYPDLYAACMFVDGQWDVSTLSGLESQKFVYFAAEDDNSAYKGMQEVMAMFDADKAAYTYQQWDAAWNADELTSAAASLFAAGTNANFVSWKTGTIPGSGSGAGVHMASFDYAYNCTSAMEWLFQQSKK